MATEPEPMWEGTEALSAFIRVRGAINERLDSTRSAIDAWIANQPMPPSLNALANLEVLLKERRDAMQELIVLHDALMAHLSRIRLSDGEISTEENEIRNR